MKKNYSLARQLLFLVTIAYITQYLGTIWKSDLLKYLSVLSQLYLIVLTIIILRNNSKKILWNKSLPFILIIFVFPLFRILWDILYHFDLRTFIDGLLINGTYYILGFSGLAMASISYGLNVFKLLFQFTVITFPIGVALAFYAINSAAVDQSTNSGLLAMVSCFIPIACFSLMPLNKKYNLIGWLGALCILYVSARVYSRSYTLVGVYFIVLAMNSYLTIRNIIIPVIIFLIVFSLYQLGFFAFLSENSVDRNESITDKFQFDSLYRSIYAFIEDGNFMHIFYWEGNSRQEILIDAFGKFTTTEWIWGRGVFGQYVSFVNRHTIELGYAQELFRWGVLYSILMFYFLVSSYKKLRELQKSNYLVRLLSGVVLIKILDMFVYGMPESSPYSFIMFWVIMCLYIKDEKLKYHEN